MNLVSLSHGWKGDPDTVLKRAALTGLCSSRFSSNHEYPFLRRGIFHFAREFDFNRLMGPARTVFRPNHRYYFYVESQDQLQPFPQREALDGF